MPRQFIEKWVLNGRDDSVDKEYDTIRSGYPPASVSGAHFISGVMYFTDAASFHSVLSISAGKVFRLKRMIVDNDNAADNQLILYNYGADSALVTYCALRMKIAGSTTEFIDDLDVPFWGGASGGIYGCILIGTDSTGVFLRLQGLLIASD